MRSVLTVSLESKLKKRVDHFAKKQGTTRSFLVKQALQRYLLYREFLEIGDRMRPYAEKAGYLTEEDIFRDIS